MIPDRIPGETVLRVTRRHAITLLLPLLLVVVSTSLLLTRACPLAADLQLNGLCPFATAGFGLTAAFIFVLDWLTTRFVLTTRRLMVKQTPLWLLTHSLRLSDIESFTARAGLIGRLFGFGAVIVDSAATDGGRLVLDFVPDPVAVHARIAAATAARGRPPR